MLTVKDAIEQRRSIRKFKSDPIPDKYITALLDSARLAPSGSNSQPWRFKIVKDQQTKEKLVKAAYDQLFIAQAPVVIVCCADIKGYFDGSLSGTQDLGKIAAIEDRVVKIVTNLMNETEESLDIKDVGSSVALNVAIAIEHIILRALDFGLGSCWIKLTHDQMVKDIFGWDENIHFVALLPIGYPDESPAPRKRLKIEDILID